jgi:hypothetical protein
MKSNCGRTIVRTCGTALQIGGVLLALFIGIRFYNEVRYRHLVPPRSVETIFDFRRWRPELRTAEAVTFKNSTYYAVRGPISRFAASGPSEYYFDQYGNYIGRNIDPGDFDEPAIFTHPQSQRRPIAIDEIPGQ